MKVSIGKHPSPGFKLAAISVPVNVGDVPGAIIVRCAHPSAVGALAAAATMAQQIAQDPTLCQLLPDGTDQDIDAVNSVALAARAGFPTLHAASLMMSPGQQKLARALQAEARTFGGSDDPDGQAVGGFFDSISDLAKSAVNSIVNAADPDHWPSWMKKIAKPMAHVALDAAATAVFGPVGPTMVETTWAIVDKAQSGDPDAEKQIEDLANKALKGDAKAKVLMSAVASKQATDIAKTAAAMPVGDAADDYMAMYGAAYDPNTWADADQQYEASSQASTYMDQQFAQAEDQAYDNPMPDYGPAYGPVYSPQYAAQPMYGYGPQGYAQPQLPAPPQVSPDGQFWFNVDHWERIPAGGIPGYAPQQQDPYAQQAYGYPQPGQPAGYDQNGWPFDANGQPWPADSNGQPMDPSQQQQGQPAPTAPNIRAGGSRVIKGAGARGGGVTVTSKPRGQAYGSNARDNRSGSRQPSIPSGFTPAQQSLFGSMWKGRSNPNDHRSH